MYFLSELGFTQIIAKVINEWIAQSTKHKGILKLFKQYQILLFFFSDIKLVDMSYKNQEIISPALCPLFLFMGEIVNNSVLQKKSLPLNLLRATDL